jgi:uncharacterized membrane protein YfcA
MGLNISLLSAIASVFIIAIIMSMVGRGGGNFYVPILVFLGMEIHQAATTGQFILIAAAAASALIYNKRRTLDWKLALLIEPPTNIGAFIGGFYSHIFTGTSLKLVFSGLLVLASLFMILPVREKTNNGDRKKGYWHREFGEYRYAVPLYIALPVTFCTGFAAGLVGVSGGSFKIPLMVIACGVPMRVAVGTSSAMVAATAASGFIGHALRGDFNPEWALPVALVAVIGGLIGGRLSIQIEPNKLKLLFAGTTLLAAVFMAANAIMT